MKHELATERLLELAYGELSPREARVVEAHAAGCEDCRAELARIRETRALMARLPVEPPPERGEGIVMAAAREAAAARGRRRSLVPPWLWAGSVGAVAVAAVAVVSWQLGKTPPPSAREARDSALMGTPAPAVAAAPPAPAAVEKAKGQEGAAPERRKAERAVATRGEEAVASEDRLGAIGIGAARSDRASGGSGGAALLGPTEPPASPLASAPAEAPKATWAAPAAPAPQGASPPSGRAAVDEAVSAPASKKTAPLAEAERREGVPALAEPAPPPPARPGWAADGLQAAKEARDAKAEADAEARRLAKARADERKARATAAASPRPPQAPGTVDVRTFAGCPGERKRIVEYGYDGRVLRYVREGNRRTLEQLYSPDGQLVAASAIVGGVRRALPLDAPGLVRLARDAGIDAPPRCE